MCILTHLCVQSAGAGARASEVRGVTRLLLVYGLLYTRNKAVHMCLFSMLRAGRCVHSHATCHTVYQLQYTGFLRPYVVLSPTRVACVS